MLVDSVASNRPPCINESTFVPVGDERKLTGWCAHEEPRATPQDCRAGRFHQPAFHLCHAEQREVLIKAAHGLPFRTNFVLE